MSDWLSRFLNREPKSAEQAKERLQLVLIHDRMILSPGILEMLKDEIITVISRHVDIDPSSVRIEITTDGHEQRLIADIPLKKVPRRVHTS